MNKEGMINWIGIGGEKVYYKNLLAKFGIKFVTTKVGKYKSAVETLTADNMSDAIDAVNDIASEHLEIVTANP